MVADGRRIKQLIRDEAAAAGLPLCGFAEAAELAEDRERLARWIAAGRHAGMAFLERSVADRGDPRAGFFPGARTVVMFAVGYAPGAAAPAPGLLAGAISLSARGRDYHLVLRERIEALLARLGGRGVPLRARPFVDASPVMEKAWARRCGLGGIGRCSLLVTPSLGSFVLLGGLATDAALEPDAPFDEDPCGECRRCVDACPTGAVGEDRTIDAARCIARLTIEAKEVDEEELARAIGGRSAYGCDICQEVCPRNRGLPPGDPGLAALPRFLAVSAREAAALPHGEIEELIAGTAIARAGARRFARNLRGYLAEGYRQPPSRQ